MSKEVTEEDKEMLDNLDFILFLEMAEDEDFEELSEIDLTTGKENKEQDQ